MSLGKKISELPVATTLTGLELAVVVQTSTTKQSTPEAITASVSSRLDNVVSVNNAALTSINNTVSALEIRVSAVSARASVNAAAITSINAEVSLKVYRTGDYMTNARYIEFDTSASNGLTTGKLAWNSNDGTLDAGLLGTTVLQIGQETLFYVKNTDTTTIAEGRLVMATGVVGNSGKIEAQRANGSGAISAEYFLGIATQDIPVGEFGYVTHFGLVRGINATGSQYGQTWAEADLLYPNTSIAGGLTNVPPPYPGFSTPLAIVVNPVSNAGSIFVRMKSGEYLEQLHDVDISAKASGDIIVWSSTLGAWTNSQAFVSAQADVSALEIRVSAVSAVASANSAAITSINNVVSALEVRVSNASAINTTQTAAITSINNVVSALEIRVSSVSAAVVSVNNVVSALSSAVAAVDVTAINAALTSINNTVSALEVRVSVVSTVNTTQTAAITSVNNVVSVLEIRVSNASTINTTQTAAITSINNVVSALEIRVSAISAQAVSNAAAITSINNVVSALEIRVSSVSAAVVSINNVVSVLSEQVSAVNTSVINAAFVSINNVVSALEVRVSGVSATTSTLTAAITSVNAVVSLKVNRSGDTMTGALALIAGSVSAPALTVSGDTNTGIYFPGADHIAFAEGGSQVGEFDASGNFKFNSGYGSVETAYGCRAWVNFNGTGTVAIRASGNVSSITDLGVGQYRINFSTALVDANYATTVGFRVINLSSVIWEQAKSTTSVQINTVDAGAAADNGFVYAAIFR